MEFNTISSDLNTQERTDEYYRSLKLPLHDMQGMMRHVLDALGAIKYRLETDQISYPNHLIQVFGNAVKLIADHIVQFEPIDSESGIKFLLDDAFPDDNKRKDNRQWLPLHWACAIHSTTPEVMTQVIEERPASLIQGHLHYEKPKDEYLENMNDESYLQQITKPLAKKDYGYKGLLPFHFLLSLKYSNIENVKLLLKKNSDVVSLPDHRGWLPLHFCAYNNRNSEIMALLIQLYPQGCYEVNKKGKLPFQLGEFPKIFCIATFDYHF